MNPFKMLGNAWLIIWNCLWYLVFGAVGILLLLSPPWGWVMLALAGVWVYWNKGSKQE